MTRKTKLIAGVHNSLIFLYCVMFMLFDLTKYCIHTIKEKKNIAL